MFLEELPPECPPSDAEEIKNNRDVFRLVSHSPPTLNDFRSQRAEKPDRVFKGVCECVARGLSVLATLEAGRNACLLPTLKGKKIARVTLGHGSGFIKPTGSNPEHRTWWPLASYDILVHSHVIAA